MNNYIRTIIATLACTLNPNWAFSASSDQSTNMKKLILLCICSIALAAGLFAQAPTALPIASPPAATVTPPATAGVSPSDLGDKIRQKMEKKLRGHHGITIDTGDKDEDAAPRSFGWRVPDEIQRFFQILQWGAISQIATAVILLICLFTILARLRRIEEALQKTK
jgi:hypothetical protein